MTIRVCELLQVVRAGGFGPILQRTDGTSEEDVRPSDHAEPADAHAVADALDCLVLVAAASSEGRTVTLQSGGLMAAATALQVSCLLLHVCSTPIVHVCSIPIQRAVVLSPQIVASP